MAGSRSGTPATAVAQAPGSPSRAGTGQAGRGLPRARPTRLAALVGGLRPLLAAGLRWDTVLYGAILAWLGAAAADYLTGPSAPRPFTGLALRAYALASATLTALTV
ncbi:hypothetical protein GCM10009664_63970 [Kitasatospora gansuensis]